MSRLGNDRNQLIQISRRDILMMKSMNERRSDESIRQGNWADGLNRRCRKPKKTQLIGMDMALLLETRVGMAALKARIMSTICAADAAQAAHRGASFGAGETAAEEILKRGKSSEMNSGGKKKEKNDAKDCFSLWA